LFLLLRNTARKSEKENDKDLVLRCPSGTMLFLARCRVKQNITGSRVKGRDVDGEDDDGLITKGELAEKQ